ncbi:hypothetical protein CKK33_05555 [Mucilaginibacter sp. MD40]|uniref:DUF4349 domain-containing protein n=1 Tax=Mucilaginibacter sp. MD40 TaxID=2029590 RepID=UPI000BAC88AB|nr:DUF4349 domain-containing protein [Mucilaginibacter sp. MD40]PAW92985.1 hypothetical protein CKK33_05555 [Mucilaginibacter sp. MD40]
MKKYLILSLLVLVVLACKQNPSENLTKVKEALLPPPIAEKVNSVSFKAPVIKSDKEDVGYNAESEQQEVIGNNAAVSSRQKVESVDKKIIKEGDISFETTNVAKTRKQILTNLKQLSGYAESDSETLNGDENRKEYVLAIRIPAVNFDAFLNSVSDAATKIDQKNIRIKDVTTEFIDTKARLNNKLELEKRYVNLLNRAGKMRDLLDIEEKLTEIRSDIESTQSQLNYMSKQVEYSSLNITFYTTQPTQVNAGNGFGYKLKMALGNGFDILQSLFFGVIAAWPFILAGIIACFIANRWRKKRKVVAES